MPEPTEDNFVQRRLLIASLISAVMILGYSFVAQTNAPPKPPTEAVEQVETPPTITEKPTTPEEPAPEQTEPTAAAELADAEALEPTGIKAEAETEIVVETATSVVTFSNRGARAKSWVLKDFQIGAVDESAPLDLVHGQGGKDYAYPFRLVLPGGDEIPELDEALFVVDGEGDRRTAPTTVTFEYAEGDLRVRKSFRFEEEGYTVEVETELVRGGSPRAHLISWGSGFGDTTQTQDALYSTSFYFDAASGLERNSADDAEEERIVNSGNFLYAGIDDLFFAAAFVPLERQPMRMETWSVEIAPSPEAEKEIFVAAAVGGEAVNRFRLFVGPKSLEELGAVEPLLRQIVDFGWLSFVAEPIFWMLRWTHDNVVANWGWAIVLLTMFINFLLFPLKWTSTKSMKRMQALQPLVKQINEKYKGLGMRDPRKAQQSEEMMALYKKYSVNPMGGCFPMLLQMPFLFAFYKVLTVAIEMRHAEWLWVADLSAPEQAAIRVLPLAMMLTQFFQQAITPQPSVDPAQMRMMKFMPLMMGVLFWGFQSGLVLYWLTGNVVGIAQQTLLNRLPMDPIEIDQPRRKGKKKASSK